MPMNWERVWSDHRHDLYAYIYRRTGNSFDAEDLLQETLLRAFDAIRKRHTPPDNMAAFLKTVSRNLLIDRYRQKQRRPFHSPLEAALPSLSHESAEAALIRSETIAEMLAVIQALPVPGRRLIAYRFVERMPIKEVALRMGASEAAVRSLQFRVTQKLRGHSFSGR